VGGFVGSEGLFGVALEITLRLLPRPACYRTVLAAYTSLEAAGDAVSRIVASGLLPGAMEIMDHLSIQAAEAAVHAGYPRDAAALLLVELEGETADVEAQFDTLSGLILASGAYQTRVAQSADERMAIWKGRKSAFSAVGRLSPDFLVQDGVVPRSRLGEALRRIEALGRQHGIRVANVFHAGDGNLHPLILFDAREAGALERAEALAADILRLCIALGGSITGEHGVGMEKRQYLGEMYGADDVATMARLRAAMDPRGVANRGKMFADGPAPAPAHGLHPLERAGVVSRM
jgi:glycolate oxidase